MTFGSVCSGILGAELAWEPLGWKPLWCAEIDRFPCAVINYRRKDLVNLGDFTQPDPPPAAVDVLVGGTPCQSFSAAGQRGGLDDPRGDLALQFAELAVRVGARWVVWENVPGVLSSGEGRDFGTFLGALVERGYHLAYRVLDAKFWRLAQQRRRVFVVGYLGDWRPPAAVLFEPPSLQGDLGESQPAGTPFIDGTGKSFASCVETNPTGGLDSQNLVSRSLLAKGNPSWCPSVETLVSHTLGASRSPDDGAGAFIGFDPSKLGQNNANPQPGNVSPTLLGDPKSRAAVARTLRARHDSGGDPSRDTWAQHPAGVRKLTPLEYERLQGFPDNWTLIPGASDSARYKAIGNAFPVPVVRWIGERIQMVEEVLQSQ